MTIPPASAPDLDQLRAGFAEPPTGTAPMMRWWWFGPTIERAELDRELTAMAEAGIGGVEVAYVYPLAPATASFVDDSFLADLRFAAERARELGLRFDLTLGSGWSFGGPHIDDQLAAQCLDWERREIPPGPMRLDVGPRWPGEMFIAGYLGNGSIQEQPDDFVRLEVRNDVLQVPDGLGPRQLLSASSRPTGQNVKRAALGAEGPVLDHYSADAVEAHLREVGDRLLDAVPAELIGSVFCDSLEVYDSDWTHAMCEEFERRRGYALLPVLHLLVVDAAVGGGPSTGSGGGASTGSGGDASTSSAPSTSSGSVRADYHRTLRELYEENFVSVVQRWAADHGVQFRIQGYGTPPAGISSYRFADLIEGEGWGWTKITQTRWASSAAHIYGAPVTSAESWTWVHSPSFRATPLDLKGEAHEHLLNGVNLLIGHGWPYSPSGAPGLGWFFYAAGALDDRNPWWPVMGDLTGYLSRLCWLLQQGEPVVDVAVYVPDEDLLAGMGRQQGSSLDLWREASERIGEALPATIRRSGFDYDLIDDEALGTVTGRYPVIVVPSATVVPESTQKWLSDAVSAGATVILVDSSIEVSGAVRSGVDDLGEALSSILTPDLELAAGTRDIGFVHRRCGSTDVYFVANTGPEPQQVRLRARTDAARVERWNPLTGRVVATQPTGNVEIGLDPYEATFLVFHDQQADNLAEVGNGSGERRTLASGWTVSFEGGVNRTVELPHVWENDQDHRHHSGSAVYRSTFELAADDLSDGVWIDLGAGSGTDAGLGTEGDMVGPSYRVRYRGPVGEVARLRVNGIECGSVWAPPYRVDVTGVARAGVNELEIVVFNTAANALAVDHHIVELANASEQRYGRRFRMQELDRAMETVRSGLLDVPTVIIAR